MDKQMNGLHPHFQRWLILLPVVLVILACNFTLGPGAQTTPVPQGSISKTPQITPLPQGSGGETPQTIPARLDPLERLLEMRSIQFNLTALQPNGTERSVQGEIDSTGNMHLKFHSSVALPPGLPEKFNSTLKFPEESELYVVDGKAYQLDDQNPAWTTTPLARDYGMVLSNLLHGPNGPGLWLDILPAGSLQSAGRETVGGFAADKYTVNRSVHGQKISGSLWYESHALVQVDLHIPAALLDPTKTAAQGELKITLEAQKASVPPVILPTPPAGTGPQSTPGSAANPPTTLSVSDRYPLPHVTFAGLGLITTLGKVWVGSANGMVDVLDARSGQVLQSIALFPGSGGLTQQRVFDLKFDGQHVWALASSKTEDKPDTLFVIDEASGSVLKQFDASAWMGDLDQKLGFSPGRIWASHKWIDTSTLEEQQAVVPWGDSYAYDGKGWMWIAGNNLSDCNPVLTVANADDPSQHYAAWASDLGGDACARPITMIGDRMWISMSVPAGSSTYSTALWAYAADGSKMTKQTHQPLVMVASPDDLPIALIGDQDGLWMLAGGKQWGYLYQFDPQTGALLNSLDIAYGDKKTITANIALDEHDLWVLMANELLRIHLK
jgi:outer membrane protein assembly factor BamB